MQVDPTKHALSTFPFQFNTPFGRMIRRVLHTNTDPVMTEVFRTTYSLKYPGPVPIELLLSQIHWLIHTPHTDECSDSNTEERLEQLFAKAMEKTRKTCLGHLYHFGSSSRTIECLVKEALDLSERGHFEEGFQLLIHLCNKIFAPSDSYNKVVDAFVIEAQKSIRAKGLFCPRSFEIHINLIRALIMGGRIKEAEIELIDFKDGVKALKNILALHKHTQIHPGHDFFLYDAIPIVFILDCILWKHNSVANDEAKSELPKALHQTATDLITQHRADTNIDSTEMTKIICKYGTLDAVKTWFALLEVELGCSLPGEAQEKLLSTFEASLDVLVKTREFEEDAVEVLDLTLHLNHLKQGTQKQPTLLYLRLITITTKVLLNQNKEWLSEDIEALIRLFMSYRLETIFKFLDDKRLFSELKINCVDEPNKTFNQTEMMKHMIDHSYWYDFGLTLETFLNKKSTLRRTSNSEPDTKILFDQVQALKSDINTISSLEKGIIGSLVRTLKCLKPEIVLTIIVYLIKNNSIDDFQKLLTTPESEEDLEAGSEENSFEGKTEDSFEGKTEDSTEAIAEAPIKGIVVRAHTHPSLPLLEAIVHLFDMGLYESISENSTLLHQSLNDNAHVSDFKKLLKRSKAVHSLSAFKAPGHLIALGEMCGKQLMELYQDDMRPLLVKISHLYDQIPDRDTKKYKSLLMSPHVQMAIAKIVHKDQNLKQSMPKILNAARTLILGLFTQKVCDDKLQSNLDPLLIKKDKFLEFLSALTIAPATMSMHIFDTEIVSDQLAQAVISDDQLFGSYLAEMMHHELHPKVDGTKDTSIPKYAVVICQAKIRSMQKLRWNNTSPETIARSIALMIRPSAPGQYFQEHRERLITCSKFLKNDLLYIDDKALVMGNKHANRFSITLPTLDALITGNVELTEDTLWLNSEEKKAKDQETMKLITALHQKQIEQEPASYISLGNKALAMKDKHIEYLDQLKPSANRKTTKEALQKYRDKINEAYGVFDEKYKIVKKLFDNLPEKLNPNSGTSLQQTHEGIVLALKELNQLSLNLNKIIDAQSAIIKGHK